MRLLLDTHIAIWAQALPHRILPAERDLIMDRANEIFVSAVSIWEIAIKRTLGRGDVPAVTAGEAIHSFREAGYTLIDVSAEHAAAVEGLPLLHGDPFDRLLVAQAIVEPLRLLTRDARVAAYSGTCICFQA